MSKSVVIARTCIQILMSFVTLPTAYAAMPRASLPIEPATNDADLDQDVPAPTPKGTSRGARAARTHASLTDPVDESATPQPSRFEKRSPQTSYEGESGELGAAVRLSMIKDGFGAQIKFLQYPRSWLAITQTLRYFTNDESGRLYAQRRGISAGVDLHPWRKKFVSPFFNSQLGWEKFDRDLGPSLSSAALEASTGLELRLGRLVSVVGQWTETYYPELKEQVFTPLREGADPTRHGTAEILFNLKWQGSL
ncbi:MAG: hypothetical protein H7249_05140 [Chitinophagaceae bacterium]|nr:hypothetical protein [Oligoflexus sp.]